jgi:Fe-Mn family superoxide dismutase
MTDLKQIIENSIKNSLGAFSLQETVISSKKKLTEALILAPKTFVLKTDSISGAIKELHTNIYKKYIDNFNDISRKLDTIDPNEAENVNNSTFRRLKEDEAKNANGAKLHELYFSNISDPSSEIRVDSMPFMRLSRDWGTFEKWQFDFRACGMCAEEGWLLCYYDPYKQKYLNTFVDKNTINVPICGIPVIVVDTFHHAWFRDYSESKIEYLNTMMKELNWSVIEARMVVAEKSNLQNLYAIQPIVNAEPEKMLATLPTNQPPINNDQIVDTRLSNNGKMPTPQITLPDTVLTNPRGV